MNVAELETARRLGHPFVVLVWSDGAFGLIEMHQRARFGALSGTTFNNPDFVTLAQSFGIAGMRVTRSGEFKEVVGRALAAEGPVVVEVHRLRREREAGHRPLATGARRGALIPARRLK